MKKQILIITVGYPGSGKSTLIREIRTQFPFLNIVNGDPLRDLLRKEMPYFNSLEFSEMSPEVKRANSIAKEYKRLVLEELVRSKQPVLLEGNHLERAARDKWVEGATAVNPELFTVILYFKISDEELLARYKERELADPNAVWTSEFKKWRKEQLEEPAPEEARELIIFNQNNKEEVFTKLKNLLL